ncbi:hypothetical protein Catovirus_1_487 [Catovirus CTV1]|uniref:Uncharacterized protein n=1 Tax=Catovirus CTV1 TaxID=1977631 RepID=A0A1V0S9P5_9VIRU|nr:hypothetical protein Catovirus_1_487 [Catovirus CTV1]
MVNITIYTSANNNIIISNDIKILSISGDLEKCFVRVIKDDDVYYFVFKSNSNMPKNIKSIIKCYFEGKNIPKALYTDYSLKGRPGLIGYPYCYSKLDKIVGTIDL